jgi:hypothetical protein
VPGRSNGLDAPRFTRLVDLDPQLATAVLDVLRTYGIAAYAAPVTGAKGGYLDVHLPDRPIDRISVDADKAEQARTVLTAELPALQADLEGPDDDAPDRTPPAGTPEDDAAWAAIVAAYEASPDAPVPPWPAQEDLADPSARDDAARSHRLLRRADLELGDLGLGPTGPDVVEEKARRRADSGHDRFVPPPPPPLPEVDRITKLAWAGVLGGPGYLVLAAIVDHSTIRRFAMLAVVAFVAGFVTLVARMKDRPPTDSGPDDGAVV